MKHLLSLPVPLFGTRVAALPATPVRLSARREGDEGEDSPSRQRGLPLLQRGSEEVLTQEE